MTSDVVFEDRIDAVINRAVTKYEGKKEELIPILSQVNHELGYLPGQALDKLSHNLNIPKSKVYSVASFYEMLSTIPVGKHIIRFCESAPCHVVGGRFVIEALISNLGINPGETSSDGKWTLIATSCLGICGVGPVFIIDDDVYGNITASQVPTILAKYE